MDPNVTGRVPSRFFKQPSGPDVTRILVRDLSEASEGNASGIGGADVTTRRLVEKIDMHKTAMIGFFSPPARYLWTEGPSIRLILQILSDMSFREP
jgi:hypothetical protein